MKRALALVLSLTLFGLFSACAAKPASVIPNLALVLGEKHLLALNYDQALVQFDEAIRLDPKNPRGYLGKADALLHLDRQAGAAAALQTGAKELGRGNPEQAQALEEAHAAVETSPEEGYLGLAAAYEKIGSRDAALVLLKRVAAELPAAQRITAAYHELAERLGVGAETEAPTTTTKPTTAPPPTQAPTTAKPTTTKKAASPALSNVSVGKIIKFGPYEWQVLDVKNGRALLITKYVLEARAYNDADINGLHEMTWSDCTLRAYLNGSWLDSNFSQTERAQIANTKVVNDDNPYYGTEGGPDTTDKVFLLSVGEVIQYFNHGVAPKLKVYPDYDGDSRFDEHAYEMNVSLAVPALDNPAGSKASWVLRTPGRGNYSVAYCFDYRAEGENKIDLSGWSIQGADGGEQGVRPALWLSL
ncbi:MAG: DUF6273 domain-containing protein [Oscillospiraceae bacterium]|jgi:tetratricopeptide (TPR) repeat protein|nr:DUF6273 domain-containing protein [Oscillospiraceae bacterium]